jgi:hypothetical protein
LQGALRRRPVEAGVTEQHARLDRRGVTVDQLLHGGLGETIANCPAALRKC